MSAAKSGTREGLSRQRTGVRAGAGRTEWRPPRCRGEAGMSTIYVTGHRNPDLDSIASAIGYAELKQRLNPHDRYVPVRIGDANAQTAWALERSGAELPQYLPHIMLRVRDVMQTEYPCANHGASIRD